MGRYAIGIDYGTLSGRALVVDLDSGNEVAVETMNYSHAVMDEYIPGNNSKLPPDFALQHPQDYLDVLISTIPKVLQKAGITKEEVVGVGIDFTACTLMPVKSDSTPLCFLEKYKNDPHAFVKLWKHHAAQDEANDINNLAEKMGEKWLSRYGGKISSEWALAKGLELFRKAPHIYNEADRLIEAGDWLVWQLVGKEARNACTAGYKANWHKIEGYPSKEFFRALEKGFENFAEQKLSEDIYPIGSKAGELTEKGAALTSLCIGTPVAVCNVDAHVAVPAVGITQEGKMLMIMGTSTCHIMLGTEEKVVPGMCGVVHEGVIPGYYGFEAGQSCVGDHFAWFVDNCVPYEYKEEANKRNISVHKILREKAEKLRVGESGLVALDWWNGNRSVLVDVDLTGVIVGLNLQTKPEEIYRALIEATAYGTRMIIDTFEKYGVPIKELYAAGGIADKDPFMMQIYSDVTNREIRISGSAQAPALGSAMFGALAAGKAKGGFDTIADAAKVMAKVKDIVYKPIAQNVATYDLLYKEYEILHDYFGRGENNVMKRLKDIKKGS